MFTRNLAVLSLAFAAEFCAVAGPAVLTLCVHEDGSIRYESALALSCRTDEPGGGDCCSHQESVPLRNREVSPVDNCEDYGVNLVQVVPVRPQPVEEPVVCAILPLLGLAPNLPARRCSLDADSPEHPRDHVLQDHSTVFLRL